MTFPYLNIVALHPFMTTEYSSYDALIIEHDNWDAVKPEICMMDVQMTNIQQGPKSSVLC